MVKKYVIVPNEASTSIILQETFQIYVGEF